MRSLFCSAIWPDTWLICSKSLLSQEGWDPLESVCFWQVLINLEQNFINWILRVSFMNGRLSQLEEIHRPLNKSWKEDTKTLLTLMKRFILVSQLWERSLKAQWAALMWKLPLWTKRAESFKWWLRIKFRMQLSFLENNKALKNEFI